MSRRECFKDHGFKVQESKLGESTELGTFLRSRTRSKKSGSGGGVDNEGLKAVEKYKLRVREEGREGQATTCSFGK